MEVRVEGKVEGSLGRGGEGKRCLYEVIGGGLGKVAAWLGGWGSNICTCVHRTEYGLGGGGRLYAAQAASPWAW